MKFTLESIKAMQNALGEKFPIIVKFTPYHGISGGREMDEGLEIARMLEKTGVAALHVDLGCYENWYDAIPTVYQPDACDIPLAEQVKYVVKIPVLGQGKLGKPEVAEKVLQEGKLDFVGLGHTMICEPNWVKKVQNGFMYDLVPCIGCNECLYGDFAGKGCHCAVNPLCGFEKDYPLEPVNEKKRLLVVGGGPGGMEAAITAADRGIEVELWEKTNTLGGTLLAAGAPSFKSDVKEYVKYITNKLYRSNVTVRLLKEATPKDIAGYHFDAVIIACGSVPLVPKIPGIDKPCVKTSTDILTGKEKAGTKNVVIGGGLVGCETALSIIHDHDSEAVIIEVLDDLLVTVEHSKNNDLKLRDMISKAKLKSICGAKVTSIADNYVLYEKNGKEEKLPCDRVVLACGYSPNNALVPELKALGIEVSPIGDSRAPRKIYEAVHEGYHAARLVFSQD
jgi:2-enoate reductase